MLTFNIFHIFKLLLTSLMYISAIVITHYWVTSLVAYLFRRYFVASNTWRVVNNFDSVGILNWRWRPGCWLFDCWFFPIDLTLFLVCRIQEGCTWILLVAIISDHVLALRRQIERFGFCKAHLGLLCHAESIIATPTSLRQFWQFSWIILELMALHNDESMNRINSTLIILKFILVHWVKGSRKRIHHHLLLDKTDD